VDILPIFTTDEVNNWMMAFINTFLDYTANVHTSQAFFHSLVQSVAKWMFRVLSKYLSSFVHPLKSVDKFFSSDWTNDHLCTLWDKLLSILAASENSLIEHRVLGLAQKLINTMLEYPMIAEAKLLQIPDNQRVALLTHFIGCLRLTSEDKKFVSDNPNLFPRMVISILKKNEEVVQRNESLFRYYTIMILKKLCGIQPSILADIIRICGKGILASRSAKDEITGEMYLSGFEVVSDLIKANSSLDRLRHGLIEDFLKEELQQQKPFTIIRALILISKLVDSSLPEQTVEILSIRSFALLECSDIHVRSAAVVCIEKLAVDSQLKCKLSNQAIQGLLQATIAMIPENKSLVINLKNIVSSLSNLSRDDIFHIVSIASDIVMNLVSTHIKNQSLDESREEEEMEVWKEALESCLQMVLDLIKNRWPQEEIEAMSKPIEKIVSLCFQNAAEVIHEGTGGLTSPQTTKCTGVPFSYHSQLCMELPP
jgi:hypothetical protein